MKVEYILRYVGAPVIVQLRDAMALGTVSGPVQKGERVLKDGSPAPKDARPEDVAYRPVWPIAVRRDEAKAPEFRYAIENAVVNIAKDTTTLVMIHYAEAGSLFELVVEADAIIGITLVREGPMPEEQPLIQTVRN